MNESEMRARLQQMATYREVCQAVRAGAGHTLLNAFLWLGLTYMLYNLIGPHPMVLVQFAIGLAELAVGLWKKTSPSVEAVLADAVVLLAFAAFILGRQALAWQGVIQWRKDPISVAFGVWWLIDAVNAFRGYAALRRAFPDRPTGEQIRWFHGLVSEIRSADPTTDPDALDLPTRPHWKAKLLGGTAFFVATRGESVIVAGPGEFAILRENEDHGTGRRRAVLRLYGQEQPDFEIADASWENYQKWVRTQPGPSFS